jgi:hypothetical protein
MNNSFAWRRLVANRETLKRNLEFVSSTVGAKNRLSQEKRQQITPLMRQQDETKVLETQLYERYSP